jgi:hypothetical protein
MTLTMAAYLMPSTLSGQQQGRMHSQQQQQQQQQQGGLRHMLQQRQFRTHQLSMSQLGQREQGATLCKLRLTTS